MWWLKWVLGYCVFAVVGLWFGYRSRAVLPGHDSGLKAGYVPPCLAGPRCAGSPAKDITQGPFGGSNPVDRSK
jgi:hypothetical protein